MRVSKRITFTLGNYTLCSNISKFDSPEQFYFINYTIYHTLIHLKWEKSFTLGADIMICYIDDKTTIFNLTTYTF